MAVNYVKGQILSGILERDGIDIAIANANVGINTTTPTVALDVNGNIQANNFSTTGSPNTGNITGANVISSVTLCAFGNIYGNNVIATGNVSTGNLLTDNLLYANGTPWDLQEPAGSNTQIQFNNNSNFGASANFTFDTAGNLLTVNATANIANINVAGGANIQGNITGGNVLTAGLISSSGNITSGNILTIGLISSTGNVTGNYFIGNGSQLSGVTATAVNANNLTGNTLAAGVIYSSLQTVGTLANLSVSGNATAGNVLTNGLISVAGNVTSGNVTVLSGNITGANVIFSNTVSATANILVGNVVIPAVGNISAGNVNINNLANPVANQDAATKYYVDQSISNKAVTNQILYGNSVATEFTLNRSTTTAAVLVILNGITQVPDQSYSMTPSPSVNLVFTEAPSTSDVIDIRFL